MRTRTARGMTLVELMVVVAIIGTLAALSAPNLIRLVRSSRVASDARDLRALLSSVRAQATTRGFPMVACLRGRTWAGGEGQPRAAFTFRKGTPLPQQVCIQAPCPAAVVAPAVSGYDPAATLPDTRSVDLMLTAPVEWALPTADNRTFQLVFDPEGQVSAFESDDCSAASVHTALGAGPWTIRLEYPAPNTDINQQVVVRPDGTVILP